MLINRQFGDYHLLRRLAVGGQSEVFLALKLGPETFSRPLVIKAMPPKFREDSRFRDLFYQEAFISARFSHPNLISVHDTKRLGEEHFMVMDYVSGQTVSDIAQRGYKLGRSLSINHVVQIVADACAGLFYVHQFRDVDDAAYSIIHCDVSPQNLMVTYDGTVKVFDFGIARIVGREGSMEGLGGGKYAYMSPEQCMGQPVDARSDIFSLGIILFELTTGFRLFRRPTKPEVIRALTEDDIPSPSDVCSDVPLFLERCILKALERDPNLRYQTAALFRDDLLHFLAMHADAKVRQDLGHFVSSLFEKERSHVAEVIRQAINSEPKPLGVALSELSLGAGLAADQSLEMDVVTGATLTASANDAAEFEVPDKSPVDVDVSPEEAPVPEAPVDTASVDENPEPLQQGALLPGAPEELLAPIVAPAILETAAVSRHASNDAALNAEIARLRSRQTFYIVAVILLLAIAGTLGFDAYATQSERAGNQIIHLSAE
ncbi:MAG: protein kinase [Bradymonadaceae bacterium]|nr:protein kinase [Lujinxingiaceae bacterium]